MKLRGKVVQEGKAEGAALVSKEPISFLGGVEPETGEIVEAGHPQKGKSVKDQILIFPHGKGSTVGSYVIYQLQLNGTAPRAIINRVAEPIVAVGAIISNIPMVHRLDKDPLEIIDNEDVVTVDGRTVMVE